MKELLTELRNKVLYLRNTEELSAKGELILLHKLNAIEKQFAISGVSKQREPLNGFRQWLIDEKKNIHIYQHLIDEYLNTI